MKNLYIQLFIFSDIRLKIWKKHVVTYNGLEQAKSRRHGCSLPNSRTRFVHPFFVMWPSANWSNLGTSFPHYDRFHRFSLSAESVSSFPPKGTLVPCDRPCVVDPGPFATWQRILTFACYFCIFKKKKEKDVHLEHSSSTALDFNSALARI